MSDQEQDSSQWQLGMQLPSRKETHGRKKKSDRKLEKHVQEQQNSPKATPKPKKDRYIEAIPEDPKYASAPVPEEQNALEQLQAYRDEIAATAAPPVEESEELTDELYLRELIANPEQVQEVLALHSVKMPVKLREAQDQRPTPSVDLPAVGDVDASSASTAETKGTYDAEPPNIMAPEIESPRDMLLGTTDATIDSAMTDASIDPTTDVATDASADEEDNTPVISKWKIALILLITPILLLIILAWGKLAYVHRVPDFVQQEVPAYQQGQGFLILKPWWFGPPIFTLDKYERTDGEDFAHWAIQLYDYSDVVHDPTVLYTFPEDILN